MASFNLEAAFVLAILGMAVVCAFLLRRERARHRGVEARLREADALGRATLESMVHAVTTFDATGAVVQANGAAQRLFGYQLAELTSRKLDELVLPEAGSESLLAQLRDIPENFRKPGQQIRVRRKDGTLTPTRASIGDFGMGKDRCFSITVWDIARAKEIGDMEASERQLREITNAVPALIAYVDTERRFRFHNRAYEEVFGLLPGEIDGRTMLEVFGGNLYEAMRPEVDRALLGLPVDFERRQNNVHGQPRDFAEHYFPRYSSEGAEGKVIGFYSLSTDITDMRRIDRMKTEFVSMVSHELRTPLTSIRGSLGLLAGGVAGNMPDAAKNLVEIAKNNCERLIRLVNDLLDTEKIEAGKMRFSIEAVELQPLIEQTIAANEGFAAQHGVTIGLAASGEGARVSVDVDAVSQVLTNLFSNAVKFSPRGGRVEVALTRAKERVRVEVRDTGPGIPEEFRARIFQKFSQADSSSTRQKGGTGLGLNISKGIVERLGGTIGFVTKVGTGTTFFFELPEWREVSPPVVAIPVPREDRRPCVLVCEDDPEIAQLIGMMLDKAGYDTDLAHSAAQARELADSNAYAAMTLDLKLPGEDGLALMRAFQNGELTRQLPIVAVTALSQEGLIQLNSETLTVSGWLAKPVDENRLVIAIRDAMAGRAKDRPRILQVEDDPDIQKISAAIARDFATFEFAGSLKEARESLAARRYDLVILDLNLPEGEGMGWSLLHDIEALDPPPPVIIFSARDVSRFDNGRIAAILVKSATSNEEFLQTIQRVLARGPRRRVKPPGASRAQVA